MNKILDDNMLLTKAITPDIAAKIIGSSSQYVRIRMQRGLFNPPIGTADKLRGNSKWCYRIYPVKLAEYLNVSNEQIVQNIKSILAKGEQK